MRKAIGLIMFISIAFPGIMVISQLNSCSPLSSEASEKMEDVALKASIARGAYFVNSVAACLDCHSQRDFSYFSGPAKEETLGAGGARFDQAMGLPGVFYSSNITPDSATGIGGWTDEELIAVITRGIRKNGDTLFPIMPYMAYNALPRRDVLDIIAYLRTLKPIHNALPQRELFIPISLVYPPFLKNATDSNSRPSATDKSKFGEFLVNMAGCSDCHTPMNEKGEHGELLAGGFTIKTPGFIVTAANLTPDTATGLGAWTEEMFLNKFKMYRDSSAYRYDAGRHNSIMPWTVYANMENDDIKAIYAYLRTVKPVVNKVIKWAD